MSEMMVKSLGTGTQILPFVQQGNQLLEPEHFTLSSPEINSLATGCFCINETKKLMEFPFQNFHKELCEMAGGSQISGQLDC